MSGLRLNPDEVPPQVEAAMRDGAPVEYGGITLRPPTDPGGRGASGQHRLEWIDPVTSKRRFAGATHLEIAWRKTCEMADVLHRRSTKQATRSLAGVTLAQLVEAYLAPTLHPNWSENRRKTVTSLLTNWVVGKTITVAVNGLYLPASALLVDDLTPSLCEQLLTHVHAAKAYRTYKDVHRELGTLLRWAAREGLRPRGDDLPGRIGRAKPKKPSPFHGSGQSVQPVDPNEIPTLEAIDRLREVARDDWGLRGATLVDCFAFGGFRISEALALTDDERSLPFNESEGVFRPYVWQQVHDSRNETIPPKHGRPRHAWVPPFMTDQVRSVAEQAVNGRLFPAPEGGWYPSNRFRRRVFVRWLEAAGWPKLDESDERERVYLWTPHSMRHHAATWMLNDLGLAPDDVAAFLGHGNGHQVWVMYSRIRPGLVERATDLARDAGDPRQAPDEQEEDDQDE